MSNTDFTVVPRGNVVRPDLIITTPAQVAAVFSTWIGRRKDVPEGYYTVEEFDEFSAEEAGAAQAQYFMEILNELNKG